jgi:hypothetical protein
VTMGDDPLDHYMDLLIAGEIVPRREDRCPRCGGRLKVRAHRVGDSLRIWINCLDCLELTHGDRCSFFAGWEALVE